MEIKLEVTSKRLVAPSFVAEVETLRGTESAACSFDATVQLVDTQLEMVRPDRLPYNFSSLFCLCRFNCDDRFQRDQVDRALQRRLRQSQDESGGYRGPGFADQGGIFRFWKYER